MNETKLACGFLMVSGFVVTVAGCGTQSRLASQLATPTGRIAVEATVDDVGGIETSLDGNVPRVTLTFGDQR